MIALKWTTEKMKVLDLVPNDFNPRKITPEKREALARSIEKFNIVDTPVINKDESLISGHKRAEMLIVLGRGDEMIDVRVPNRQLSIEEVKEYMLIANTHAGEFDAELLEVHFSDTEIEFEIPVYDEEPKQRKLAQQSTMEKFYYLNIRCTDEQHCQELYDRMAGEGLEVKIVT